MAMERGGEEEGEEEEEEEKTSRGRGSGGGGDGDSWRWWCCEAGANLILLTTSRPRDEVVAVPNGLRVR
jgi:hypothetical protein